MLNDAKIKAAKATGKRYELADGDGLYLDVTPTGSKIWRYRYRLLGQREKVTIGPYPAIPLSEARARRLELAAMVARGRSPSRELERDKRQSTQAGRANEERQDAHDDGLGDAGIVPGRRHSATAEGAHSPL